MKKIRDGIHLITEPYFYEHANLYLIEGMEYDLLIDCGLGLFNIKEFLQDRGFKPRVFLTHAHFDHAGGVKHFNPEEILVTERVLRNAMNRELWGLEYLKPQHLDEGALEGVAPREFCNSFALSMPTGTQHMSATRITIGEYQFQIIPAPGHTDDSVMLYDKHSQILISGDALYDGAIYEQLPNSDKVAFGETLAAMKACEFALVLPGHNEILERDAAENVIDRWSHFLIK